MAKKKPAAKKPTDVERAALIFGMQMQHVLQRIEGVEADSYIFPADGQERIPIAKECRKELQTMRLEYDRAIMLLESQIAELKSNPLQAAWAKLLTWFR